MREIGEGSLKGASTFHVTTREIAASLSLTGQREPRAASKSPTLNRIFIPLDRVPTIGLLKIECKGCFSGKPIVPGAAVTAPCCVTPQLQFTLQGLNFTAIPSTPVFGAAWVDFRAEEWAAPCFLFPRVSTEVTDYLSSSLPVVKFTTVLEG